jgi:hypothetical protein
MWSEVEQSVDHTGILQYPILFFSKCYLQGDFPEFFVVRSTKHFSIISTAASNTKLSPIPQTNKLYFFIHSGILQATLNDERNGMDVTPVF